MAKKCSGWCRINKETCTNKKAFPRSNPSWCSIGRKIQSWSQFKQLLVYGLSIIFYLRKKKASRLHELSYNFHKQLRSSFGEIYARCWMVLIKSVIQLNCTDLERWLWLVVIHFNPLHFHVRLLCASIDYFMLSTRRKSRVQLLAPKIYGLRYSECVASRAYIHNSHANHQFAYDTVPCFTVVDLAIFVWLLFCRWAVVRHHQPRDVINCDNCVFLALIIFYR